MKALRRQVRDIQPAAQRSEVEAAISYRRRGQTVPYDLWRSLSPVDQGRVNMHDPAFNAGIKGDAAKRMAHMDSLPPDVRAVAHDLGFAVVHSFYKAGIKKANTIRHLICMARGEQVDGRPAAFGNYRIGSRQ